MQGNDEGKTKGQMKARQEAISKMSEPVYNIYRHRVKALADTKKRTKEARDNIHKAWRTNPQLGFKEISLVDLMPEYASLTKAAIDKRGYTDVETKDIIDYVYKRPEVNLLTSYAKGLEGWADRVVPPIVARTAYMGPNLTGRAPMAWGEKMQAAAECRSRNN